MAERFLYLPAIAAAGCAVLAWHAAGRQWPRTGRVGPVVLLLMCGCLTMRSWARNADWHDEFSLWSSSAEAAPNGYKTDLSLSAAMPPRMPTPHISTVWRATFWHRPPRSRAGIARRSTCCCAGGASTRPTLRRHGGNSEPAGFMRNSDASISACRAHLRLWQCWNMDDGSRRASRSVKSWPDCIGREASWIARRSYT